MTYADGLADIDLGALLEFHAAHGAEASMTVVRPRLQFGVAELDEQGSVRGFREKPRSEHWINGGFFCFEARARRLRAGERARARAARCRGRRGRAAGHRHDGFWECMDTYKDTIALNDLWASGAAPWTWGAGRAALVPGGEPRLRAYAIRPGGAPGRVPPARESPSAAARRRRSS